MTKLVILDIPAGNFENGFSVTLKIAEEGKPSNSPRGKLPPAPEIPTNYRSWQESYRGLSRETRLGKPAAQITNIGSYHGSAKALTDSLLNWYKAEEFRKVRERLLQQLDPSELIRLIVQPQDPQLLRLPWHIFFEEFLEHYHQAEVALAAPEVNCVERDTSSATRSKVRILAILGNSEGINVEADQKLIEQLPGTDPTFLNQPTREVFHSYLWEQDWDILFFAGHSSSRSETGRMFINKNDSLTIEELKYALREAIARGLKLAIFNSCDGLGLAESLAELQIPQIIVMREDVPDVVAQEFLKYFLDSFSKGKSLYQSVRKARERLKILENQFPHASWLPVIFQNPTEPPLYWKELYQSETSGEATKPLEAVEEVKPESDSLHLSNTATWQHIQYENIPRSGTVREQFFGRDEHLQTLHSQLKQNDQVAVTAVAGMGGLGKTELTIQYARQHLDNYRGGVCWLDAKASNIGTQIIEFARTYFQNFIIPEELSLENQMNYCWRHWPEGDVLVVLDDVDNYPQVQPYLPPSSSRFNVLITTRLQLGKPVQQLSLDLLSPESALELLASRVGSQRIERELDVAKELCEWLEYLPLGLELVGRYVEQKVDLSLKEMLSRLKKKGLEHKALVRAEDDPTWSLTGQRGISEAFALSWESLSQEAQQLGCLLSLLALAPIPWSLVEQTITLFQGEDFDEEELEDARDELLRLHLLQRSAEKVYRLHQLIREFARYKLRNLVQKNNLKRALCKAVVAVAEQVPISRVITQELISSLSLTLMLPHMVEVGTNLTDWLEDEDIIWPFRVVGKFYSDQCFYEQAESWYKKNLEIHQARLSPEHLNVAESMRLLAYIYRNQVRYPEAKQLFEYTLKIHQKLSEESSVLEVASCLKGLGLLSLSTGDYHEAESLLKRALDIRQQLVGTEDSEVKTILNNVAIIYNRLGRYKEAEDIYSQLLEDRRHLYGNQHTSVSFSLNNLAMSYKLQGRYNEAESLLIEALGIDRKLLGEQHLRVVRRLQNLGTVYIEQERYNEAEVLLIQVLEIRKKTYGEYHRNTSNTLHAMAELCLYQNHYEQSENYCQQALEIRKQLLGEEHPVTAESWDLLASIYNLQNRREEAERLYAQALEVREQRLGLKHPQTISTYEALEKLRSQNTTFTE